MNCRTTVALLCGREPGVARALTWLPDSVLADEDPASSLTATARRLRVSLAFVPGNKPWSGRAVNMLTESGIAAAWVVDGVFGRLADLIGWSAALMATAPGRSSHGSVVASAGEAMSAHSAAGLDTGACALVIADDLAFPGGPLASPEFVGTRLLPVYAQAVAQWAERGMPAIFHSDGDLTALYGPLAEAGFSAVHVCLPGCDVAAGFSAAASVGLCPVGGVPATGLDRVVAGLADEADVVSMAGKALAAPGVRSALLADDGGMTERGHLEVLGRVFDLAGVAPCFTD